MLVELITVVAFLALYLERNWKLQEERKENKNLIENLIGKEDEIRRWKACLRGWEAIDAENNAEIDRLTEDRDNWKRIASTKGLYQDKLHPSTQENELLQSRLKEVIPPNKPSEKIDPFQSIEWLQERGIISTSTFNILANYGIINAHELSKHTAKQISRFRNVGEYHMGLLAELLMKAGLNFAAEKQEGNEK